MSAVYTSKEKETYHLVPAVNETKQLSPVYLINRERKERKAKKKTCGSVLPAILLLTTIP